MSTFSKIFPKTVTTLIVCLSVALAATVASPTIASANDFGTLHPFSTDGCTDFPDGTLENPNLWVDCCIHHDLLYWAGGTRKQKLSADEFLFQCISKKSNPLLGAFMFVGVAIGGTPYIKDSARWGYGWPKIRGFAPLSDDEREQVQQLTPKNLDQIRDQISR
jgi:hypothetical protein